jgi:hypothetical protein
MKLHDPIRVTFYCVILEPALIAGFLCLIDRVLGVTIPNQLILNEFRV